MRTFDINYPSFFIYLCKCSFRSVPSWSPRKIACWLFCCCCCCCKRGAGPTPGVVREIGPAARHRSSLAPAALDSTLITQRVGEHWLIRTMEIRRRRRRRICSFQIVSPKYSGVFSLALIFLFVVKYILNCDTQSRTVFCPRPLGDNSDEVSKTKRNGLKQHQNTK